MGTQHRDQPPRRKLTAREAPAYTNMLFTHPGVDADCSESGVPFPAVTPTDRPVDIVLGRLRALGCRITGAGGRWMASCPAHADSTPSLSITGTTEDVGLVNCW